MKRWQCPITVLAVLSAATAANAADDTALCADADARYAKLGDSTPAQAGEVVVKMYKYRFCPSRIEIAPGTVVRWVNLERTTHNAWFKGAGQAEPDRQFQGESWSFTFSQPGEYPYLCGPHGEQEGMTGVVVVRGKE